MHAQEQRLTIQSASPDCPPFETPLSAQRPRVSKVVTYLPGHARDE
jgi:hypothetical protein